MDMIVTVRNKERILLQSQTQPESSAPMLSNRAFLYYLVCHHSLLYKCVILQMRCYKCVCCANIEIQYSAGKKICIVVYIYRCSSMFV